MDWSNSQYYSVPCHRLIWFCPKAFPTQTGGNGGGRARSDTGEHASLYSAQDAVLLDFDNGGFYASGGTPPPLRQGDATALVFATLSMATCRLVGIFFCQRWNVVSFEGRGGDIGKTMHLWYVIETPRRIYAISIFWLLNLFALPVTNLPIRVRRTLYLCICVWYAAYTCAREVFGKKKVRSGHYHYWKVIIACELSN